MNTLYFELNMGASGDMLMATLYELIDDKNEFLEKMNSLGFNNVKVEAKDIIKSGIKGTNISVIVDGEEEKSIDIDFKLNEHHHHHHHTHKNSHEHDNHEHYNDNCQHVHTNEKNDHKHSHSSMKNIVEIIEDMEVSQYVKNNAISIYELIAEAESVAHNKPVNEIHFHEVGDIDAIYDIVGNCILMEMINPDKIIASPIHVGFGHVKCAHGIMPIPAPATAFILKDIPIYGGGIQGELCTPTGAAILKHFVNSFGNMPMMNVKKIGYGMGKKDFEAVNCVRGFLGESGRSEDIIELVCTMDDITGEEIGYVQEILFESSAIEVYTTNIQMKKNRPGIMLTVLCLENDRKKIQELIFKHTTTIGIKEYKISRTKLERTSEVITSKFGKVRAKVSKGYGVVREKYEYEDLKKIAKDKDLSIRQLLKYLE